MTDKRVELITNGIARMMTPVEGNAHIQKAAVYAQAAISADPVTEDVKRMVEMAYKDGYDDCDMKGDDQDHNECWDESAAKYELTKWSGE